MDENKQSPDPDDQFDPDVEPQPEPQSDSPDPSPGGPNAVEGVGGEGTTSTVGRDLPPDLNPVSRELLPDEAKEGQDTDTEATKGNPEVGPQDESPA